jgi:hypothetical protein
LETTRKIRGKEIYSNNKRIQNIDAFKQSNGAG